MTIVVQILVGLGLLTLGRQLFWLFVGGVGFFAGVSLATRLLTEQPDIVIVLIGLAVGLLGAVLAILVQRLAVAVAGFIAGGVALVGLVNALQLEIGSALFPFLIGAVLGLILVTFLFDWALIGLSALAGATLIVQALSMSPGVTAVVTALLFALGIAVQASQFQREQGQKIPAGTGSE